MYTEFRQKKKPKPNRKIVKIRKNMKTKMRKKNEKKTEKQEH